MNEIKHHGEKRVQKRNCPLRNGKMVKGEKHCRKVIVNQKINNWIVKKLYDSGDGHKS